MARLLKVCADRPLDDIAAAAAEARAVSVRPDNVRVRPFRMASARSNITFAAVEKLKLWPNGKILRVGFLDGDPVVQQKVAAVAKQWEQFVNLRLDFGVHARSEVRVSFAQKGLSWSTVGTDALTVSGTRATMNYGWLDPASSDREYQRVVLHEFGHALGLIHEHQNPAVKGVIPWDKEKVYAYYAQQGWDRGKVDENIFDTYAVDQTNFTAFDPDSIMEYPVPDALTVGSFAIGWNTALSPMDKAFMRRQYPVGVAGPVRLTVGGADVSGDLGTGGEVDVYTFRADPTATYIAATRGSTDVVMTLFGPDDPSAVLASDDDRGQGRNARIVRKLRVGDYWLQVRHKQPDGTGQYQVGLQRRKG